MSCFHVTHQSGASNKRSPNFYDGNENMEAPRGKWETFLFLVIHLLSLMWTLPCLWLDNRWNKGSQVPKFQLFFFVSRRISFFMSEATQNYHCFFLWGNLFSLTGHIILGNSFHFKPPKTIFSSGHFLYMLKKKKPSKRKKKKKSSTDNVIFLNCE